MAEFSIRISYPYPITNPLEDGYDHIMLNPNPKKLRLEITTAVKLPDEFMEELSTLVSKYTKQ